ncbi:hypothetical protein ACF0H5_015631 [Mactra antiquata]
MLRWIICIICVLRGGEVNGILMGDCPGVDLPCTLHRFSGVACLPDTLNLEFPGMYQTNTSNFPGMPGSLDISAKYKYFALRDLYKPEINLTFTPPQSGAKNYVKGFEIFRTSSEPDISCYILDLSNVTWNDDINELSTQFRLELFPLKYRFNSFTLYALPKQQKKDEVYDQHIIKYVELPEYVDGRKAGSWKASVYKTENNNEGSINVTIDPPPEEFGFTRFEYTLLDATTGIIHDQYLLDKLSVEFKELYENHTYKVWVKPFDPYYQTMDKDQCLCLDADELACQPCTTTTTRSFLYHYTGPPKTQPPVTITTTRKETPRPTKPLTSEPDEVKSTTSINVPIEPEGVSDVKVAFAIIGSLLGIGLIVGIAGFLYYRRCRSSFEHDIKDNNKQYPGNDGVLPVVNPGFNGGSVNIIPNNSHSEKMKFEKVPKLVLLYEEDHGFHRQVVQHFAMYLQQHCHCAVMCVEWQLDAPWVHEDIEQADYIVIVNSEGAYQSYIAQYGLRGSRDLKGSPKVSKQMSNINSIRNKFFLDERYDNVVMVYFEYTDEQFVIPDICPGYKYKLLKHFTDFLLHIHKLRRTDNLSLYDLPLDGSFNKKPVGQLLLEAMNKATQYQHDNPNWIKKKMAYNRMTSHTSEESQFDSGLPEDWNRIPSVENSLSFYQSSPDQKELLRMLDGNSICTVNPADIGVSIPPELDTLSTVSENVPSISVPKARPKLSPHCFNMDPDLYYQNTPTPPTCGTVESDFGFFPPDDFDDNFDAVSKTVSEQMKSIVDRYQACTHGKPFDPKLPVTSQEETVPQDGELPHHINVNPTENYDRNNDLYLLRVQSGEVPFTGCHIDGDVVSLGGESV